MTKTEIALHLIRCTPVRVASATAQTMIAEGLATVRNGKVMLTPAGHNFLRQATR